MAKIPEHVKVFVVMRLAEYATPTEVADLVEEEFDIKMERQQVHFYDPTRKTADTNKLAKKWVALYEEHQAAFKAGVSDIGIANKAFRLQRLDFMARRAERMRNYALAASLHEQAAKEMGGYFTNKRELTVDLRSTLAQLLGVAPDALPDADHHTAEARRLRLVSGAGRDVSALVGNGKKRSGAKGNGAAA